MAQAFTTGPVDLWVGVGSNGAPVFLGHAEEGYEIQPRPQWENVMNDVSGMKVPYDRSYQGFDAMITPGGGLTRWNEAVYAALQNYGDPTGTTPRGSDNNVSRGSLMATEDLAFQVWLRYPYATTVAAFASLPAGYHFTLCVVESDSMRPGTRPYKVSPSFYAWAFFRPGEGFVVYDGDMSALGAIN